MAKATKMKSFKIVILLIIAYMSMGFTIHPFHASITELKHNSEQNLLEVTVRLFTDDLGMAIGEEILIGKEQNENQSQKIRDYVRNNLIILDPNQKEELQLSEIGQETEYDISFVYFEIRDFWLSESYKITQTVLFDQFDDQANIVNFIVGKETYSDYFTSSATEKTFSIE